MGSIPDRHTADFCMTVVAILASDCIIPIIQHPAMGIRRMRRKVSRNIRMTGGAVARATHWMVKRAALQAAVIISVVMTEFTVIVVNTGDDISLGVAFCTLRSICS